MATCFCRVDLSPQARDFRPVAIEPGVPLLDRSGANDRIVFRWLGGMAAEPVWEGEGVGFFSRDDHGGRLAEVTVQPATIGELNGPLKGDLDRLRQRLAEAKPETGTERALHTALLKSFQEMVDTPDRTDLDAFFFKFRDGAGNLRLVWCWGYRRVDQEPSPAVVCTSPECNLLFIRRAGNPKCPACAKALMVGPRKRRRRRRVLLPLLLLLLAAALIAHWWTNPPGLVATPGFIEGPTGSRIELKIQRVGLIPFWKTDVTQQAVGVVLDPAVAQYDQMGAAADLIGQGQTVLRLHLGDYRPANVTLVVGPPQMPERLRIEPAEVELGVGTTAQLRLFGQMKDGSEVELTNAAEWPPQLPDDKVLYSRYGFLEGIGEGTSQVTARYRATPDSEPVEAVCEVRVRALEFRALEAAVAPAPIGLARASRLRIDAVAESGEKFSVLGSSRLKTEITPAYLASVEGPRVRGETVGAGKLAATFGEKLTAGTPLEVVEGLGVDGLTVTPEKLDMVVGQIADLGIVSPSMAPISITSGDSTLVEVSDGNRLIARGVGETELVVSQGGARRTVPVAVSEGEVLSVAMTPPLVVVPIDHDDRCRVTAHVKVNDRERRVEMAPDRLQHVARPSPRNADLQPDMRLSGIWPTTPATVQQVAVRLGEHLAAAAVHVVVAPMRLEVEPRGSVDLPHGQMVRLEPWAHYSGGRAVQVLPERAQWHTDPKTKAEPGLELRGNRVAALKPGGGPLPVWATYFGNRSNRVIFQSVEADPNVVLNLETDRTLRLVNETGELHLAATGPKGDVELVPEMAEFDSSEEKSLAVDKDSGAFRAMAPGTSTVTASHAAAQKPASLDMQVVSPDNARLVFEPERLTLSVGEVAPLRLLLEVDDDGKPKRTEMLGPGIGYTVSQPDSVSWDPPRIAGLRPSPPLRVSAGFPPYLDRSAVAEVEVAPVAEAPLRIVPSAVSLTPGQVQPLRVEQQVPGSDDLWKEVSPAAVDWLVPRGVAFMPARDGLRPTVSLPEGARGEFELTAAVEGRQALALVSAKPQGPDPDAEGAELVVHREGEGMYLAEGQSQRYTVMVRQGDELEPAAEVRWMPDFENDYVCWQAPVLTAKRAGYEQRLRARVGDRNVLLRTITYRPGAAYAEPAPGDGERPVAVRILSDQGPAVEFPVGARFDDFRVEAEYDDGFTQVVTRQARFQVAEPVDKAPLTPSGGMLVGVRPGQTTVNATFEGVATQKGLQATVTAEANPDALRLRPSPATIMPGETISMEAEGFKQERSIGLITGLGPFTWQTANPEVASISGPALTGRSLGKTTATAQFKNVRSEESPVSVVSSIADALVIDPKVIRLRVGQSVGIGTDVLAIRGDVDFSRQCRVTPALTDVVRYDSATHSLIGVSPGMSAVAFAYGDKLANVMVEVFLGGKLAGEIVVEPGTGDLAAGQALPLRVYVLTDDGQRIDRTASAVLTSSAPATVTILGNRACAVAPGEAQLTATLPDVDGAGRAHVRVNEHPIEAIALDPARLDLIPGDTARIRVLGRAPSGTHELFPQESLRVTTGGASPSAIRISGGEVVEAAAPGEAAVEAAWQGRLKAQAPVSVTKDAWSDLVLEPGRSTVHPGHGLVYQLSAIRGGQRRVLTAADGVELYPADSNVAQSAGDMAVVAMAPGRTAVVARLGAAQAEALLDVVPGSGPGSSDVVVGPGGRDVVYGPGYGYYGVEPGGRWVRRVIRGPGTTVVEGIPGVIGRTTVDAPAAGVVGLRFIPDVLRLPLGSPGARAQVVEVLADGSLGGNVSNHPMLEISEPGDPATVEKTEDGPVFRPVAAGQTRVGARLGPVTADPLLISVGEGFAGGARLVVTPNPLPLWTGQEGSFGAVAVDPGDGQTLMEVDYQVQPRRGQGIVEATGPKILRGLGHGDADVRVSVIAPGSPYDGLSAVVRVTVGSSTPIVIEPNSITLTVGQATPPLRVYSQSPDGQMDQVPATLEATDPTVLEPDPLQPGQFVARALGSAQVRAIYRGREAFATIRVSGDRFLSVDTQLNARPRDFDVSIEVLAAESEGPLEYRVYPAGQPAAETWVPSQADSAGHRTSLRGPRMAYGERDAMYHLILEARNPRDGSTERYPLTFRIRPEIERIK
ncbi:MAG: hypothetical protein RBS80_16865 [Thermoguttaceae bacterium]|jgi:hypothetical protein|nr:hypothetical protein [Thermoguttaceae bacterium]